MNTELKGYSGCKIFLLENENEKFVRKISKNYDYNRRLEKQFTKQINFKESKEIKAPKILEKGFTNGLFYFDMEYIDAKPYSEIIFELDNDQIKNNLNLLVNNLSINKIKKINNTNKIFNKNFDFMKENFNKRGNKSKIFNKAILKLRNFNWEKIPCSDCHGDLTLQNIIPKDNKIYLIDFFDPAYSSWMVDIARILQDLDFKWSYLNTKLTNNQNQKLLFARNILMEKLLILDNHQEIFESIYNIMLNNITNILSHLRDQKTFDFANNIIEKLLLTLSTNKYTQ